MSFSYFLSWESPHSHQFLQATLMVASECDAEMICREITTDGILIIYDKELSQEAIMKLSLELIETQHIYTPDANISNDLAGQER